MMTFLSYVRQIMTSSFDTAASTESNIASERLLQAVFESDIPAFLLTIGVYFLLCFLLQFARKLSAFVAVVANTQGQSSITKVTLLYQLATFLLFVLTGHFFLFFVYLLD
jgi:hypothetical protein